MIGCVMLQGRNNRFSTVTDDELDQHCRELHEEFPRSGYREMTSLLETTRSIKVPRDRVMLAMRRIDPEAVAAGWSQPVSRRQYRVSSANAVWHVDTNHSLIK